jgi:hypothetical protein
MSEENCFVISHHARRIAEVGGKCKDKNSM